MILKEQEKVWGTSVEDACLNGRMRSCVNYIIFALCALVICSIIDIMKSNNVSFISYIRTTVYIVIISYAVHKLCSRNTLYKVYKFHQKYRNCDVCTEVINLTQLELRDILYKIKKVDLGTDVTLGTYISMLYLACISDSYNAKSVMTSIARLNTELGRDNSYTLCVTYVISKHGKYLIEIKEK